jgi:hypothetical protein
MLNLERVNACQWVRNLIKCDTKSQLPLSWRMLSLVAQGPLELAGYRWKGENSP